MNNLLFTLLILASYELDVWLDWKKITVDKKSPAHGFEAAVVSLIYIALSLCFYGFAWLAVSVFFLVLALRWLYFDIRLNIRRGLPFNYIGKNAMLDKMLRKLPYAEYSQYIIKFTLILITILLI